MTELELTTDASVPGSGTIQDPEAITTDAASDANGQYNGASIGIDARSNWPQARRFVGDNDRTYISFLKGSDQDAAIKYYDHDTEAWSDEYIIGSTYDDHGTPAISITSDGTIHAFYSGHGVDIKYKFSSNPEDITSWSSETAMNTEGDATYPRTFTDGNDNIYLFARVSGGSVSTSAEGEYYFKSTDSGSSFSRTKVIDHDPPAYAYITHYPSDNEILMEWSESHGWDTPNIRFVRWNYSADTWKTADGTTKTLPMATGESGALAYDSGTRYCKCNGVWKDSNDHYYMVFREFDQNTYEQTCDVKALKWDGSSWSSNDLGVDVGWASESEVLDVHSPSNIDLYLPIHDSNRMGPLKRYHSSDGLIYSEEETLISGEADNVQNVQNASDDLRKVLPYGKSSNAIVTGLGDALNSSSQALSATVYEDVNGDGTAENTATQSVGDGTNTYTLSGFDGSGEVWVSFSTTPASDDETVIVNSTAVEPVQTAVTVDVWDGEQFVTGVVRVYEGGAWIEPTRLLTADQNLNWGG